ncbi:MAG: hydroxylamine reductase [Bacteroidales bacterium]
MFCFQCQEAAKGTGCTIKGVCGKNPETAGLQDLLVYTAKGISIFSKVLREKGNENTEIDRFLLSSLFITITNANFDDVAIHRNIKKGLNLREELKSKARNLGILVPMSDHHAATWHEEDMDKMYDMAGVASVTRETNEDIRSLKELVIYGVKGMAAYAKHAENLGYNDETIIAFIEKALVKSLDDSAKPEELIDMVLECGKFGVNTMALLDKANTATYGNPEITEVNIGVRNNPAILISGHDLRDMQDLLEQTRGTGVDVYTHSEMLPANYYPAFKKYDHFVGNYGNSWWKQNEEFETFNGPVLFTTNCLVPPRKNSTYTNRVYTTGESGYPGFKHIPDRNGNGMKDFSEIIEHAKRTSPPQGIEEGSIVGGFAHNQVLSLADKIVDAVKKGKIRKFVVMAGCDGRMKNRDYYTQFAGKLPGDVVILTAGCAKYRYNKLPLGDIDGIPRVLDAGQCNDSYSLAVIALKLKEVFNLNDINELPIAYNIAWYEQKAVIVLLALLYLGVKNIHLGPSLPAFLSPNVANVLVDKFGISGVTEPDLDMKKLELA